MHRVVAAAIVLLLCSARSVFAQGADWPERVWIGVNGGMQTAPSRVSDTFSVQQFVEAEQIDVRFPAKAGPLVSVNGGYRLWRRLGAGVGVTHVTTRGTASITAQIPHPFFFNQFRQVQGTSELSHTESSVDAFAAYLLPLSDRLRLIVSGGPSAVSVNQVMVTGVQVSQDYPYDTASFASATMSTSKKTVAGVNGGADVFWMFSQHLAAGALVHATHARVNTSRGAGTPANVQVTAGGVQAGAGIRFLF
jgi:Outer membrane protein beta-barrel domain